MNQTLLMLYSLCDVRSLGAGIKKKKRVMLHAL